MNPRVHRTGVLLLLLALVASPLTTPAAALAAEIGTNDFAISQQSEPGGIAMSGVAYNSVTDQYLVVWEGIDPAVPLKAEIRGQLIDARTGAAVGPDDFLVASIPGDADTDAQAPDVVYNPARNEFVVVFIADEFDESPPLIVDTFEVYAQRVSAAGAPTGSRLRVSDMGSDDANGSYDAGSGLELGPEVAYNAADDEYLVVWRGDDDTGGLVNNELEIFSQRLGHGGAALVEVGTNDVQVSDVGGANGIGAFDAREPSVAWNSTNNEYLVGWQADDDEGGSVDNRFHIWAQRVSAGGAEVGTNDFRVSTVGGVADTAVETFSPDVAYNSTTNEYLVVWEGDGANGSTGAANDFEIWGQRLTGATAVAVGSNTQISQMGTPGTGNFTAQVASAVYNPASEQYLVAWRGDTNTGGLVDDEQEIFGTRLSGSLATVEAQTRISDMGPNGAPNLTPQPPAVAYSERAVNDYLVSWAGENAGVTVAGETEVWGQLIAPSSDLRMTKSASPPNPATGEQVTYTLNFTNAGPETAFDVVISDLVPAALGNVSFTSTGPTPTPRPGTTFVWDVSSLTPGQSGSITITATVGAGVAEGTVLANTASIETTTEAFDPNRADNTATANLTVDNPPRLLSVDRSAGTPTNGASVDFVVTFDQGVSGVSAANFELVTTGVSGAGITTVTGSGATRTVTVDTGTGDGTVGLDMVNGSGVVDTGIVGGKPLVTSNLPFTGQVYTIDKTPPTLSLTSAAPDPTNASPIHVTAAFSEPVTGLSAADLDVGNGTAANLTGGGAAYEFDVTPAGQGVVTVDVPAGSASDLAGNGGTAAAQLRRTFDSVAPTVTLTSSSPDPTNLSSIPVTAQFSEAVTGFTAGDVSAGQATVNDFTAVDDDTYTFDLVPTGQGLVTADVGAAVATDSAGSPNDAAAQLTRTFDDVAPTTTLSSSTPDPTNASTIPVLVEFSEDVTGFTAADVAVGNGTTENFAGSGSSYSFDVTPTSQGEVTVDVAADVATDPVGNGNAATPALTRLFDSIGPDVTIEQATGQSDPTGSSPIVFSVEFSESVAGFTETDVVLSGTAGATTAVVTGSGSSYQVDVTGMTGTGTVTASLPAASATDAAGNPSRASTGTDDTVMFRTGSAPVIAVAPGGSCPDKGLTGTMMLTVSDPDGEPVAITVASSNTRAVPLSRIRVDQRLPRQSITIDPRLRKQAATSMVTLTATDGAFTSQLAIRVVVGTSRADSLTGTNGSDLVIGRNSRDTIRTAGGIDLLCGGNGNDVLRSGSRADTLDGSAHNDRLVGFNGTDKLVGRPGSDRLFGGAGDDSLLGRPGADRLRGGRGADAFSGGLGNDVNTDFARRDGDTTDGT